MSEQTTVSSCCVSGSIHTGTPTGSFETVGGVRTYVAKPKDGSKAKTAVFIADIFGVDLPNSQLVADEWAKNGYYVYLPDIFEGDAVPHEYLKDIVPNLRDQEKATTVQKLTAPIKQAFELGPWIAKHREAVTKPIIDGFFKTVKEDPQTGKIVAVGFCFGGRYSILAGRKSEPNAADVAIAFHPSFLSVPADLESLVAPTAVLIGDKDAMLPADQVAPLEKELVQRLGQDKVHVKVYPNAVHGFSIRGDDMIESEKKQKEDAHNEAIKFADKYI